MQLFYSEYITPTTILLPEEESVHCTKVLRRNIGHTIQIIDGKGTMYDAEIMEIHKKQTICSIKTLHNNFGVHPYFLRMCVAPTKNIDRFEFFIEKAVEMGVNEIIPIQCENSERIIVKPERLERICISAMKQSYKAQKPIIAPIQTCSKILLSKYEGVCCIAHCSNSEHKKNLFSQITKGIPTTILIGPEGDFSKQEIQLAQQHNWIEVHLGTSRLRTETAAIAAVHTVYVKHSE
jgi:16S rRNA (uracil1498-N3)-methyltransferase